MRGTGRADKAMVSLRIDRETLDELDLLVRKEGFKSRRELLERAFEEFREMRTPRQNVVTVRVRLPKEKVGEMDHLIGIGDQKSWEGIIEKSLEQYLALRLRHLRELPAAMEEAKVAVKSMKCWWITSPRYCRRMLKLNTCF